MSIETILHLIDQNLFEIVPELEDEEFSRDETLVDLGLNSIDRGELITLTLENLELEIPRVEFVAAKTINELAKIFEEKLSEKQN